MKINPSLTLSKKIEKNMIISTVTEKALEKIQNSFTIKTSSKLGIERTLQHDYRQLVKKRKKERNL